MVLQRSESDKGTSPRQSSRGFVTVKAAHAREVPAAGAVASAVDEALSPSAKTSDDASDRILLQHSYWCDLQQKRGTFRVDTSAQGWQHRSNTRKKDLDLELYARKLDAKNGLSEFLLAGTLSMPWEVYVAINIDVEHRPQWDTSTVSVEEVSADDGFDAGSLETAHCRRLHWLLQVPAVSMKRDYIFEQHIYNMTGEGSMPMMGIESFGVDVAAGSRLRPLQSGVTRCDDWYSHLLIWPSKDGNTTCMTLLYFEDPKLSLPNWVIAKMIASGIPGGIQEFADAGKKYPCSRLRKILNRFGSNPSDEAEDDEGDEEFFSCSEDEECLSCCSEPLTDSDESSSCFAWSFPHRRQSKSLCKKTGWLRYLIGPVVAICQIPSAHALVSRLSDTV